MGDDEIYLMWHGAPGGGPLEMHGAIIHGSCHEEAIGTFASDVLGYSYLEDGYRVMAFGPFSMSAFESTVETRQDLGDFLQTELDDATVVTCELHKEWRAI